MTTPDRPRVKTTALRRTRAAREDAVMLLLPGAGWDDSGPPPGVNDRRTGHRWLATIAALPLLGAAAVVAGSLPDDGNGIALLVRLLFLVNALTAFFAAVPLLRRASHHVADAPETTLDEREIDERGVVHRVAFGIVVGGLLPAFVVLASADLWSERLHLASSDWVIVSIGGFFTAALLPAAVACWRQPELPD